MQAALQQGKFLLPDIRFLKFFLLFDEQGELFFGKDGRKFFPQHAIKAIGNWPGNWIKEVKEKRNQPGKTRAELQRVAGKDSLRQDLAEDDNQSGSGKA